MTQRTALITGGNAGLGLEFARQLAARGYTLVLVARRQDKLDTAADELRQASGATVHTLVGDLSDPDCPAALLQATQALDLPIDLLVNNAGASGPNLLSDRDWSANARFLELMITSVAHMCHHFIPPMVERGHGRVINVASVAGRIARPSGANYGPSKAYVIALSEELALTLEGTGVQVCALCPGFTHTDFHATGGLSEMKSKLPSWLWYDADVVVAEGLAAVEQGKSVYLSGRLYRWADPFLRSPLLAPLLHRARRD
jgi:short-subunit dehydrogenase